METLKQNSGSQVAARSLKRDTSRALEFWFREKVWGVCASCETPTVDHGL